MAEPLRAPVELLVVFKLSAVVGWLDPSCMMALAQVELPAHPHELLVDPDRRRAYVSIYGNGIYGDNTRPGHQLAVLSLDDRALLRLVDLGEHRGAHGLALDAGGNVWVSCDRTGTVAIIDPDTLALVDGFSVDPWTTWATPHWIVATPNGRKAYTSNKATPYLTVLDMDRRRPTATVDVPTGGEGLALDGPAARLYVADHSGAGLPRSRARRPLLRVVDTASDTVTVEVPLELPELPVALNHEIRVRVTPDDRHVLVSGSRFDRVLVLDVDDLEHQRSIVVPGGPTGFAFAPDYGEAHRDCLVAEHDAGRLTVLDVDAARVLRAVRPVGLRHDGPETLEVVPRP